VRGDVYRLRADAGARGHEQRGPRYGVVVQATRYLHLSRWLVAPTSTSAQPAVFRPEITLPSGPTLVLCDATTAVDPQQRFAELVTHLSLDELGQIDRALLGLLDLL
jgi:mRNA interferase MazF